MTVILYGVPLVEATLAQPGFVEWSRLAALPFAGIFTSALVASVFYALKWVGHTLAEGGTVLSAPLRIQLVVGDRRRRSGRWCTPSRAGRPHLAVVAPRVG